LKRYGIEVEVVDTAAIKESGVPRKNFSFIVCDDAEAYPYLPPYCTIVVFSPRPAAFFTDFLLDVFLSLSGGANPSFILYLSDDSEIKKVAEEWGYAFYLRDDEKVELPKHYAVIGEPDALKRLGKRISGAFLIPDKAAEQAFCDFLKEILLSYLTPDAIGKISADL